MTATTRSGRPLWASVALTVRTGLTAAALTLLFGLGAVSVLTESPTPPQQIGLSAGPLDHLMTQNRCSYTGFDQGVVPSRAIIRDTAGTTKVVSFDRGWAVFTGKSKGELVAVCLGPKTGSTHS